MKLSATLIIKNEKIPCVIYAIGIDDNGYTTQSIAIALVNGKLEKYPIELFENVKEEV